VETETAESELKLSNTTGRLVQLEREVGLLRQNNLVMNQQVEKAERLTNQAKRNAEEAQQVKHTHWLLIFIATKIGNLDTFSTSAVTVVLLCACRSLRRS